MITITKIRMTCFGCPSQWDGYDANNVYYYFRYRWGALRVDTAPTKEESRSSRTTIYSQQVGAGMDGVLSYSDLRKRLQHILILPDECEDLDEEMD